MILCFALGLAAALARSDLTVPEAMAKAMSLYLLFAIGFKGGVSVASHGLDASLGLSLLAGVILSFALPFIAYALLRAMTQLSALDAAAVSAHYGSISIVTFVTATTVLAGRGIEAEGYMVAVAAAMEAPAIVSALWLVARSGAGPRMDARLWREILLNGSIVLLVGSFLIGALTGDGGMTRIESFIVSPVQGVLCLFLLDMGLIAARRLMQSRKMTLRLVFLAILLPLVNGTIGTVVGTVISLDIASAAALGILAASASYIAVPAAMRLALPEADPGIYLSMSLGVTFPFNIIFGISIFAALAQALG
jgi:hypothetical protein